jgi:hypothetical protein
VGLRRQAAEGEGNLVRIRSIKPEFWKDEEIAALDPFARLLFIGLWGMADNEGRLEDRPKRIKAEIFPYDDVDIEKLLHSLTEQPGRFIERWETDGQGIIEVRSFTRHQRISGKEAEQPSRLPKKSENKEELTGKQSGNNCEAVVKQSGSNGEATVKQSGSNGEAPGCPGREGKGRERKGVEVAPTDFESAKKWIRGTHPSFGHLRDDAIENELKAWPRECWGRALLDWRRDVGNMVGVEVYPLRRLRHYLGFEAEKQKKNRAAGGEGWEGLEKRVFRPEENADVGTGVQT